VARDIHENSKKTGATSEAAGEAEVGVALDEVVTAVDEMACVTVVEHRATICVCFTIHRSLAWRKSRSRRYKSYLGEMIKREDRA